MNDLLQNRLDTFRGTPSEKEKIIIIYGPTGSGKTGLSIDMATYLQTEIISCDARQIYRELDIGTGKVTTSEMRGIPHHLLDVIDIAKTYSVVEYRDHAESIIASIHDTWKIPIICGGTGLYIDSIAYERSYSEIPADWELRDELENYRLTHGNQALWQRLYDMDPIYAEMLHINNYRYIMRGIEIYMQTGISKSQIQDLPIERYDTLWITPYDGDRASLYDRINLRVQTMFDMGLVAEVQGVIMSHYAGDLDLARSTPGLNTIGYREVVSYLSGEIDLETCISLVQQHNRNYAKRQITWNRKYPTGL